MRTIKLLILLLPLFLFFACQNKKPPTEVDVKNKAVAYKVGDVCKITKEVLTASTDSDYSKVQRYINNGAYNRILEKMAKDGNYIKLMYESLTAAGSARRPPGRHSPFAALPQVGRQSFGERAPGAGTRCGADTRRFRGGAPG